MKKLIDILSYYGLTKITKTDIIGQQLKEYLKTNNEWIPYFNDRILPSFKPGGKKKHNNRTGLNTFNSDTKVYNSNKRNKIIPLSYTCDFETEKEADNVRIKLQDLGINVGLQNSPSISIKLEFSQANKFISKFINRIIPIDAHSFEVFAIKDSNDSPTGKEAYIGYKLENGNFEYVSVPYTEPKEQSKIKLISVRPSYLIKFVDPNKEYPVSYIIKQNGEKINEPSILKGCDLTEKQIIELFEKELL